MDKSELCRLEQSQLIKLIENNELVLIDDVAEYIAYITCPVNAKEISNIKGLIALNKEMLLNWLEDKQDLADYDKAMQDIGKTYTHDEVKRMLKEN